MAPDSFRPWRLTRRAPSRPQNAGPPTVSYSLTITPSDVTANGVLNHSELGGVFQALADAARRE
jgi:hypothetical protein